MPVLLDEALTDRRKISNVINDLNDLCLCQNKTNSQIVEHGTTMCLTHFQAANIMSACVIVFFLPDLHDLPNLANFLPIFYSGVCRRSHMVNSRNRQGRYATIVMLFGEFFLQKS